MHLPTNQPPKQPPKRPQLRGQDLTAIREAIRIIPFIEHFVGADYQIKNDGQRIVFRSPWHPDERTPSCHFRLIPGQTWMYKDFSKGDQGGGVLEFVTQVRAEIQDCWQAAWYLLDHQLTDYCLPDEPTSKSHQSPQRNTTASTKQTARSASAANATKTTEKKENKPISADLRYAYLYAHSEFARREVGVETLKQLGIGFIPPETIKKGTPLNGRIVFQVRGVRPDRQGQPQEVILSHIGRATTAEQTEQDGKWWIYGHFLKSQELYNLHHLLLNTEVRAQIHERGEVLVVEGAWDVAKLWEAGIWNVVATFGATLCPEQLLLLRPLAEELGAHVQLMYDRDQAGREGTAKALALLADHGLSAHAFDWQMTFSSAVREAVMIPPTMTDPADFSVEQLQWLRSQGII